MDRNLESKLYQKYPDIFPPDTWHFWFEHGDGWFSLIDTLCLQIQNYIERNLNNNIRIDQVVALQVKEKFGGLRFYYTGGDEVIDHMVLLAEAMSFNICELCGSPATPRESDRGWVHTFCDKCREKRESTNTK